MKQDTIELQFINVAEQIIGFLFEAIAINAKFAKQSAEIGLDRCLAWFPQHLFRTVQKVIYKKHLRAPSYILLKELFQYLKTTPMVKQQFPFIKSQDRFEQNWMVLHLQLLKSRLVEEKNRSDAINDMELQKFNYNAQTYFFAEYSKHVHPQIPTKNFASHFSEAYLKKYRLLEQTFQVNYQEKPTEEVLQEVLRKMIYEGRVGPKDAELLKLSKYYVAHRRYLSMLEWQDLLQWKIKWGFEQDRGLLQHLSK